MMIEYSGSTNGRVNMATAKKIIENLYSDIINFVGSEGKTFYFLNDTERDGVELRFSKLESPNILGWRKHNEHLIASAEMSRAKTPLIADSVGMVGDIANTLKMMRNETDLQDKEYTKIREICKKYGDAMNGVN